MNAYKEALEKIRNECGLVCGEYQTCDHPACRSSYEAWEIAEEALTQNSNISSTVSSTNEFDLKTELKGLIPKNSLFKTIIVSLLIICLLLAISALSEVNYNKKWINKNSERIEKLEGVNYVEFDTFKKFKKIEFDTFKKMTSDEFERTWRSFGIIRNNFLALGTGFHLGEKDMMNGADKESN